MNGSYKALESKWLPVLQKAGCTNAEENKKFLIQVYRMLVN